MFFVVELGEFYRRNKDKAFVMRFENKVKKLVAYFEKFENAYGLLENLEKWIFVEWSRANDQELVNGINYPSNMMYYMMLECAYNLFGNERYKEKATKVKAAVCKYGFDGKFFVDHADIINGEIVNRSESTEVCQYYVMKLKTWLLLELRLFLLLFQNSSRPLKGSMLFVPFALMLSCTI